MVNCETNGHLWNALHKCVMCGTPKPQEPTGLHSCPFCGSFDVKLFIGDGKRYAHGSRDTSTCSGDKS